MLLSYLLAYKKIIVPIKQVMHTVRDWLRVKENNERPKNKLHPRRHIFHHDFAVCFLILYVHFYYIVDNCTKLLYLYATFAN
jgi:hypothetical protein